MPGIYTYRRYLYDSRGWSLGNSLDVRELHEARTFRAGPGGTQPPTGCLGSTAPVANATAEFAGRHVRLRGPAAVPFAAAATIVTVSIHHLAEEFYCDRLTVAQTLADYPGCRDSSRAAHEKPSVMPPLTRGNPREPRTASGQGENLIVTHGFAIHHGALPVLRRALPRWAGRRNRRPASVLPHIARPDTAGAPLFFPPARWPSPWRRSITGACVSSGES